MISRFNPGMDILSQVPRNLEQDNNSMGQVMNVSVLDLDRPNSVHDLSSLDLPTQMSNPSGQDLLPTQMVVSNQLQMHLNNDLNAHLSQSDVSGTVLLPSVLHPLPNLVLHDNLEDTTEKEPKNNEQQIFNHYMPQDMMTINTTTFLNHSIGDLKITDIPQLLHEYKIMAHYLCKNNMIDTNDTLLEYRGINPEDVTCDHIATLLQYYKQLASLSKRVYPCIYCNKILSTKASLITHENIHIDQTPYICQEPNCNARFKSKSALNTHINNNHTVVKMHVCEFIGCNKRFATEWQLRQHMVRHPQNHRYTCKQCNHTFAYPYQLNRHLAKHTNNRPFHCSYQNCTKSFSHKGALLLHEKAHEKLFVCNICLRRFGYKCDLTRHMARHTDIPQIQDTNKLNEEHLI
ncbi:hypothetical protein WA158_005922 [Blastocystis sp. Blastoise]